MKYYVCPARKDRRNYPRKADLWFRVLRQWLRGTTACADSALATTLAGVKKLNGRHSGSHTTTDTLKIAWGHTHTHTQTSLRESRTPVKTFSTRCCDHQTSPPAVPFVQCPAVITRNVSQQRDQSSSSTALLSVFEEPRAVPLKYIDSCRISQLCSLSWGTLHT
jgi:negative regulator of sigma E activity